VERRQLGYNIGICNDYQAILQTYSTNF